MKKSKLISLSFIFFLIVILVLFTFLFSQGTVSMGQSFISNKVKYVNSRLKLINDDDCTIYYIGNSPFNNSSYGDTSKFKFISPDEITEDNMPVLAPEFSMTVRDPDGNIVDEIKGVERSFHNIVIVTEDFSLSDDNWEIIRNCAADNKIKTLVFGEENITDFRNALLYTYPLKHKSMFFETANNIIYDKHEDDLKSIVDTIVNEFSLE